MKRTDQIGTSNIVEKEHIMDQTDIIIVENERTRGETWCGKIMKD